MGRSTAGESELDCMGRDLPPSVRLVDECSSRYVVEGPHREVEAAAELEDDQVVSRCTFPGATTSCGALFAATSALKDDVDVLQGDSMPGLCFPPCNVERSRSPHPSQLHLDACLFWLAKKKSTSMARPRELSLPRSAALQIWPSLRIASHRPLSAVDFATMAIDQP